MFFNTEIMLRKQLRYPPFCDIILIGISSANSGELINVANGIYEDIKKKIKIEDLKILLYKPVPAPIDRIKNKFRWRIIIKCKIDEKIIESLKNTIEKIENTIKNTKNETRVIVDVNPSNML